MVRVSPPDALPPLVMVDCSDPVAMAKLEQDREWAKRNDAWLRARADEINANCWNRYICVAGEELFVGNSMAEVLALAKAAHPEDDSRVAMHLPIEVEFFGQCLYPGNGKFVVTP